MSTAAIITVSANACVIIITALLLSAVMIGGQLKEKLNRLFLTMVAFNFVGGLTEVIQPLIVRTPFTIMDMLGSALAWADYIAGTCMFIAFVRYLYAFLSSKKSLSPKPFTAVACVYSLRILVLAAVDLRYYLSGSSEFFLLRYQVQIHAVIAASVIIATITIILRHIKSHGLKKREWVSLLLYLLAPLIMLVPEYLFEGVWLTWLGGAMTVFLIYGNIHIALGIKVKEQEAEMAENRISLMLSQIQPHFLYNSLSAIEDLCDADIERAKTAINDFAHYLRGNLKSITPKSMLPFEEELEHVETYLSLEKLRFGERLRIVYEIEATDFNVPPLTVQPIAENAVRHGLMKKSEGGIVKIRAERSANAHIITVEDDGVGFDPNAPPSGERIHVGIQNVRERLKALCSGTLEIESAVGSGAKCVITIPMAKEAAK